LLLLLDFSTLLAFRFGAAFFALFLLLFVFVAMPMFRLHLLRGRREEAARAALA
jgi:SNF family Na+-dependent transporter